MLKRLVHYIAMVLIFTAASLLVAIIATKLGVKTQ